MGYHGENEAITPPALDYSVQLPARTPKLLERVRECCRVRHYSRRTERAYVGWIRRFVIDSGMRHPREMGAPEVEAFLTRLATDRQVAASTQNQALAALLFLYRVAPISKTAALAGTSNRVSEAAGVPSKLQESPRPVEERAQPNLRVIGGGPGVDTIGDINPEGLAEYNAKHGIDHKPDVPKVRFLTPFENEGTPNQTGPAETSTKVYTPPVE